MDCSCTMLLEIFLIIFVLVLIFVAYVRLTRGVCKFDTRLDGKTVIVTGANSGIGFETAKDLAGRGARVIIACRSEKRGQAAVDEIKRQSGSTNVLLKLLDLSLMASVRKFADEIIAEEERLDILINNAGVSIYERVTTSEGLEMNYATNHFGTFLLTNLLLEKLKASAPSRIVTVASEGHRPPFAYGIDFENLKGEKPISSWLSRYGETKLANVLFTRQLAKVIEGTGVSAFCLCPGFVKTELVRDQGFVKQAIYTLLGKFFIKTPKEGAQTSIYCAVAPDIEKHSGSYFRDCALYTPAKAGQDDAVAKKLWEASELITGLA